jgi:hypothetical protein
MNWRRFTAEAPELAALGLERLERRDLCLLGTLRRNGWPRISPCEVYIVEGEILLGMMWKSTKALDLLRDPRLTLHTLHCDREGTEGDFKLYGRAIDAPDPTIRRLYGDVLEARIEWRPTEPFHLFSLDVQSAGYIEFGAGRRALRWTSDRGVERVRHPEERS